MALQYTENVALTGFEAAYEMYQVKDDELVPIRFGIYDDTVEYKGLLTETTTLVINDFGLYIWNGFELPENTKYDINIHASSGMKFYVSKVSQTLEEYGDINSFLIDLNGNTLKDIDGLDAGKNYVTVINGLAELRNFTSKGIYYIWTKTSDFFLLLSAADIRIDVIPEFSPTDYFVFNVTNTTNPPPCNSCRGKGKTMNAEGVYERCTTCNGSGTDTTANALEVAFVAQPSNSSNELYYAWVELDDDDVCPTCHGALTVENPQTVCPECNGAGYVYTNEDGTTVPCAICHGSKYGRSVCNCVTSGFNGTKNIRNNCRVEDLDTEQFKRLVVAPHSTSTRATGPVNIGCTTSSLSGTPTVMVWTASSTPITFSPVNPDMNPSVWSFEAQIASEGGTSECLAENTLITMADGSQKRIDEITVGEVVLDKNGKENLVYRVSHEIYAPHRYYYFSDGTVINEVMKHRFYNVEQGFYQLLQLWNIGEHAVNSKGEEIELIRVEEGIGNKQCFGIFTVAGNYYANGLLSGQAKCNTEFLADMTIDKAIDMLLSIDSEDGLLTALYENKGVLQ